MPTVKKESWKLALIFLVVALVFVFLGWKVDEAYTGGAWLFGVLSAGTVVYDRFISK